MNVSTRQLSGFVHTAQLGSFTRAAERLHLTQAGVSAIVRQLESQMGCRLLDRTTRTVTLTEAGRRLLPIARRTLEDLAAAASELDSINLRARQTIRVGATPLVACRLLPLVCQAFRRTHPEVTVRILELQRSRIQELVEESELDLGLGIFLERAAGIERTALFASHLMRVAPARTLHRRHTPGSAPWSALRNANMVALQPDNPVQQLVESHLRAHAGPGDERYAVNHIETQIAMVAIGMGEAVIPSFALPACANYRVQVDALVEPVVKVDFCRIVARGRALQPAVEAFTQTLVGMLKPLPAPIPTRRPARQAR